jgi:hypothetical protein
MFPRKPKTENSELEKEITHLLQYLATESPDSEGYAKVTKQLVKLYPLRNQNQPPRVSPDTVAIIAGNVLVTTIIVGYEQKAVIASKAKDFWMKLR